MIVSIDYKNYIKIIISYYMILYHTIVQSFMLIAKKTETLGMRDCGNTELNQRTHNNSILHDIISYNCSELYVDSQENGNLGYA